MKERISVAEISYNKIEGFAKDTNGDYEYWESQLPNYQKNIDNAKALVQKEGEKLAAKGVNVDEIEKQTKITEDKISELDARLDNLPEERAELIELYRLEKQELQRENESLDLLLERSKENEHLFKTQKAELILEEQILNTDYKRKR